jgi:hypothetical protein
MADDAILGLDSARPPFENHPDRADLEVRGIGRELPRKAAPEGWVKKIDRPRTGKVWVGFFHL